MTRVLATLTATLLLLACEGKPPQSDLTAGETTDDGTTGDGASDSGTTTTGPSVTTVPDPTTGNAVTGGDTAETTCSFVCETTGGGEAPVCDNWTQDCPDGEKCSAWANDGGSSWNSLKCVDVEQNPAQPGDPCTVEGNGVSGVDSCDLAMMCWDVDNDTGQGNCVSLCTGTPEAPNCADPNTTCVIANEGVLNLCLLKCDPLLQDCAGDDLCLPNPNDPDGFVCVLDASGETGVAFDPCEYGNACDKGLVCQDPGLGMECDPQANGCCLPYCDLTMPDCPGVGQDCLEWYEPGTAPPGYENLGLCGIPMG